jgi:hypothetical protein
VTGRYTSEEQAKRDTLCRPLTMAEVMRRTGRSQRTIERWTTQGLLTKYEIEHPREIVFLEREVLEVDRAKTIAAIENRERIRRRGGRPGSRSTQSSDAP